VRLVVDVDAVGTAAELGVVETKNSIWAKASVTMMKKMPLVRSTSAPVTRAKAPHTAIAAGRVHHSEAASYFGTISASA